VTGKSRNSRHGWLVRVRFPIGVWALNPNRKIQEENMNLLIAISQEDCIAYESVDCDYWVERLKDNRGYKVWKTGVTHSTLSATIGYSGSDGLDRAIRVIDNLRAKGVKNRK
jgi:hypothetical protein